MTDNKDKKSYQYQTANNDEDGNRRVIYEELSAENNHNKENLENSAKKLRDLDREFGGVEESAGEIKGNEENAKNATNKIKAKQLNQQQEESNDQSQEQESESELTSESSSHKAFIYKSKLKIDKRGKKKMGKMNIDLDEITDMHDKTKNQGNKNKISKSSLKEDDRNPLTFSGNNINNILSHKVKTNNDMSR